MKHLLLHPEQVVDYWSVLRKYVERALEHGRESTSFTLLQQVMNNQAQCWIIQDDDGNLLNVTITEMCDYPNYRALRIIATAGDDWDYYKEFHSALEDYALENECKTVQFWGRPGWQRYIKKLTGSRGETYEMDYVVMSMVLKENDDE